jgi:hypothetical protein
MRDLDPRFEGYAHVAREEDLQIGSVADDENPRLSDAPVSEGCGGSASEGFARIQDEQIDRTWHEQAARASLHDQCRFGQLDALQLDAADHGRRRRETPLERLDRNLHEMISELRVVVTGVQMLFAFLLIVPFNVGFARIGGFERTVYFVTLLLTGLAAACTIAPSAQHRFLFRQDDKRHLVLTSNRLTLAGLGFLSLAICGCLLLVATKLFGVFAGILTATLGVIPFAALWFAMPLWRRATLDVRGDRDPHSPVK